MTKTALFLQLAIPDEKGISRWVSTGEFNDKYDSLKLGNGGSWCRAESMLAKKYIIEFDRTQTSGNSIDMIRLNGFNTNSQFRQTIKNEIKKHYCDKNCVMLGVNGKSINTKIEIDHKDGRKNNELVSDIETQSIDDFQPLCKAANDIKRQICKVCKATNKRWDARNIKGNPYSFYSGDEEYNKITGCKGCYQYDPVEYRKESIKKISKEAAEYISKKFFDDEDNTK